MKNDRYWIYSMHITHFFVLRITCDSLLHIFASYMLRNFLKSIVDFCAAINFVKKIRSNFDSCCFFIVYYFSECFIDTRYILNVYERPFYLAADALMI